MLGKKVSSIILNGNKVGQKCPTFGRPPSRLFLFSAGPPLTPSSPPVYHTTPQTASQALKMLNFCYKSVTNSFHLCYIFVNYVDPLSRNPTTLGQARPQIKALASWASCYKLESCELDKLGLYKLEPASWIQYTSCKYLTFFQISSIIYM